MLFLLNLKRKLPHPHTFSFPFRILQQCYKVIHKLSLSTFHTILTSFYVRPILVYNLNNVVDWIFRQMATAGEVLRRNLTESFEVRDDSSSGVPELHVLAVDDSLVDRKVIERLLKISSCKVTAVESGTRALQYLGLDGERASVGFDGLKVNLIMTDYSMPGMTGYELLKKIKESSVLREIPVVVMSSENILTRIDSCLEEGAEEFLLKPVKLADVKRLKDFIMRGDGKDSGETRIHKRRRQDDYTSSPSPSPSSSPSPSPSPSPSCDPLLPLLPSSSPSACSSKRVKVG